MAGNDEVRQTNAAATDPQQLLAQGNLCFLCVTGRHFLVRILELDDKTLRVSFPGKDYPIEGMRADMEFHDEEGYSYCASEVVRGPMPSDDGIVLRRPSEIKRCAHRSRCRIPTDLTVQVKDQNHVRRYNASLLNLSAGGALIETDAPFDFTTRVELDLSLPGESLCNISCQVAEILPAARPQDGHTRQLCLRFSEVPCETSLMITHFVWRHMSTS